MALLYFCTSESRDEPVFTRSKLVDTESVEKLGTGLANTFRTGFCFSAKQKKLTNNSIHKTFKTTFTFMLHYNQKAKKHLLKSFTRQTRIEIPAILLPRLLAKLLRIRIQQTLDHEGGKKLCTLIYLFQSNSSATTFCCVSSQQNPF